MADEIDGDAYRQTLITIRNQMIRQRDALTGQIHGLNRALATFDECTRGDTTSAHELDKDLARFATATARKGSRME